MEQLSGLDAIMQLEEGEGTQEDQIAAMQKLIDSGEVWSLQGSMGRAAMDMLKSGMCVLGENSHTDYYGNKIPSRTEVRSGELGSVEYANSRRAEVGMAAVEI